MSKIPMLVRAGLEAQTDPAFDWRAVAKRLQSHKAKLRGAAVWDYLLDPEIDGDVDLRRLADQLGGIDASNDLKNQSLYSGVVKDAFVSPHESISPESARGMLDRSTARLSAVLVFERATRGAVSAVTPELVRDYVAAIARLHGLVRDAMASDLDIWDLTISSALEKARAAFGDVFAVGSARIVECEDGEEEHDVVEIVDDPIKRRRLLAARTFHVQFLANGYVSSKQKTRKA